MLSLFTNPDASMRLKLLSLTGLAFSVLGQPLSAQVQQGAAGAPITFANGSYRFDDMTVTLQIENPGIAATPVVADIKLAPTPCSATRACGATFDLRVRSITPPPVIASGVEVPVTIVIDNAGRMASPAADVALCRGLDYGRTKCAGPAADLFTLPELAPGQTATITRGLKLQNVSEEFSVAAVIDPDGMLTEKIRSNNARAATTPTAVEEAKLEMMDYTAPAEKASSGGSVTFTWRVRNPTRIASVPAIPLKIGYRLDDIMFNNCTKRLEGRAIEVPAVPARAVLTVQVTTSPMFSACRAKHPSVQTSQLVSIEEGDNAPQAARVFRTSHSVSWTGQ